MNVIQKEIEECIRKEIQRSPTSYADGILLHTLSSSLKNKDYNTNSSDIQYIMRKYKIMKRLKIKPLNEDSENINLKAHFFVPEFLKWKGIMMSKLEDPSKLRLIVKFFSPLNPQAIYKEKV